RLGDDSRERIGAVVSAVRHHLEGLDSLALQTRRSRRALARRRSHAIGAITSGEDEWRFGDSLLVRAEYREAQSAYRVALHRLAGSAQERANYLLRRARMALMRAQYAAARRYYRRVLTLHRLPSQI